MGYIVSLQNSNEAFQIRVNNLGKVYCLPKASYVQIGDACVTNISKTHCALMINNKEVLKSRKCDKQFLDNALQSYIKSVKIALKNLQTYQDSMF